MSSPGEAVAPEPAPKQAAARRASARAERLLADARQLERLGQMDEAMGTYRAAIAAAEVSGERHVLAEALRLLAVTHHRRDDTGTARTLCARSHEIALELGDRALAGAALNTMGGFDLMTGALDAAEKRFLEALELGASNRALCARAEQNLGIIANIRGRLDEAHARYARSLEGYLGCGDRHGCAIVYHNLGMVSSDRERYDEAATFFERSCRSPNWRATPTCRPPLS